MTAVTMSGRVTIGDRPLRCPGTGAGMGPSRLRLVATGGSVRATCDRKHAQQGGGAKASCWWVVDGLTAPDLAALAEAKPGRVRAQLSSGAVLEGRVATTDGGKGSKEKSGKPAAKGAFAKLKAAAMPKSPGKPPGKTAAPTATKGSSGAAVAAFGALAAVAGAVGQTARATADIVGSGASVTREFTGVVRDGIRAVDNAGARDLVRHTTQQQAPAGPAPKGRKK
ncbi:hypothetical protein MTQ13_03120 [Streptomyces sp. XM4011]|uniref:hypothetical protein n=1 Tax=Streptomyces sp. XM4011 TaxID=2929780 RepID=UPI001FFAB6CB|nr:hypothetical protein [Streptomyces sp. XM4011]MCK1813272.1 hypothetical protein [Streptomyces sp. XM4011]